MVAFPNRVLFLGFGAVARCTLRIFVKHVSIDPERITIMDFEPSDAVLKPWIEQGMTFVEDRVTPENLGSLLGQHVSAGDLLIDLAWNIDCCEIVQFCHDRGVLYANTSVELWDPYAGGDRHPTERTLYWRHMNLRRMISKWSEPGPTAVLEHGANPNTAPESSGRHTNRSPSRDISSSYRRSSGRCPLNGRATGRQRWRRRSCPALGYRQLPTGGRSAWPYGRGVPRGTER